MHISRHTNISKKETPKEPTPDFALVFYDTPENGIAITRHAFHNDQMQAGVIIDQAQVFSLLQDKRQQATQKQEKEIKQAGGEAISLMPTNVLFEDADNIVWHQPSRKMPMWFRLHGQSPFALDVTWPALLFMVKKSGDSLTILALDTNERPTLDSMTYWAPMGNVYAAHNLCQGSAPLPKERTIYNIAEMEATFYESAFDSFKHNYIFKGAKDSSGEKFWQKKQASGEAVNAQEELYPCVTLREILENRGDRAFFQNTVKNCIKGADNNE
ncbi:hypothetical protein [Vibrio parahaemolyticus]|uniref:hypothetical protein n=1 Tax=Vibrio parahaemolyticus TaxID=670 RepID=UPI0023EB2D0E|nr:hypothetical protein [Vibrio parahaemolyticus]